MVVDKPLAPQVAGCTLLLFAQPIPRIFAFELDDVIRTDGEVLLRLGTPPTPRASPYMSGVGGAELSVNHAPPNPCVAPRPSRVRVPRTLGLQRSGDTRAGRGLGTRTSGQRA